MFWGDFMFYHKSNVTSGGWVMARWVVVKQIYHDPTRFSVGGISSTGLGSCSSYVLIHPATSFLYAPTAGGKPKN